MLEQTTEIRTLDDGRVLVLLSGSAYGTLEFAGIEGFKLYMEHCREYLEEKGRGWMGSPFIIQSRKLAVKVRPILR